MKKFNRIAAYVPNIGDKMKHRSAQRGARIYTGINESEKPVRRVVDRRGLHSRKVNESARPNKVVRRGYKSGSRATINSIHESYNTLLKRKRMCDSILDGYINALYESGDEKMIDFRNRADYLNKKLSRAALLESDEVEFLRASEDALRGETEGYISELADNDSMLAEIRDMLIELKKDIDDLRLECIRHDVNDIDLDALDFEDDMYESVTVKKNEADEEETEEEPADSESKEDDEEAEDSEETEEEPSEDDGEEEVTLASIIIEVTDVDAVIEELKDFKIPEDAIKVIEKEEDEDEGKIKIDADYVTELGEYCKTKGWDLEDALGGEIVKDDDDTEDEEDEEKKVKDAVDDLDLDSITDEDLFGPSEDEEKDSEEEEK